MMQTLAPGVHCCQAVAPLSWSPLCPYFQPQLFASPRPVIQDEPDVWLDTWPPLPSSPAEFRAHSIIHLWPWGEREASTSLGSIRRPKRCRSYRMVAQITTAYTTSWIGQKAAWDDADRGIHIIVVVVRSSFLPAAKPAGLWMIFGIYLSGSSDKHFRARGRSQMTSAKFSGFWTPSPPCQHVGPIYSTKITQPRLLRQNLGNPLPPPLIWRHLWMAPIIFFWVTLPYPGYPATGHEVDFHWFHRKSVGWPR